MKFVPFTATENNMDRLYMTDKDFFILKTKCGEVIACSIGWEQGHQPNYFFESCFFNKKVRYEEIAEIAEY